MKTEKVLPFKTLMRYAEDTLCPNETERVSAFLENNPEKAALVTGLQAIYSNEGLDSETLEKIFVKTEKRIDRKIYLHSNFSNHLIELNRQLRTAAAVFFLIFTFSFLSMGMYAEDHYSVNTTQHGPYDLAFGSKIAP